ncbi:MAG: SURF1 family protein [Gammaproteobacteria bacterium]|nr:SURF1 family protein [Gammaproteobacteria bacterium]
MRIRFGQWEFAPNLSMAFVTALGVAFFTLLGSWQLQRAELKRDIEQRYLDQLAQPYQYLILDDQVNQDFSFRKVRYRGRYHEDVLILLDNQVHQGQVGYHVLVPFVIGPGSKAVLVNRGWVAAGFDRSVLPDIRPPQQPDEVMGILTIPSTAGFRMGEVEITGAWPQRVPYLDLQEFQQGLAFDLYPYVIWLAPETEDYYVRNWQPIWSAPEKSEAYAVQWFSFGVIAVILFIVLNTRKVDMGD